MPPGRRLNLARLLPGRSASTADADDAAPTRRARFGRSYTIGTTPDPNASQELISRIVAADLDGVMWLDRFSMMQIPAVRRGRQVIAGTVAGMPLTVWRTDPDGRVVKRDTPAALAQPESFRPRINTLMWTVDDLLFYPYAWWRVVSRDPTTGFPTGYNRLEPWRVTWSPDALDATGRPIYESVYVDGQRVSDGSLIRFDGPDEGLIELGSKSLGLAAALERQARAYAGTDLPAIALKYTGSGVLPKEDAERIRNDWEEARAASRTAVLSAQMDAASFAADPEKLQLIEARQYEAVEVARLMNLPPRYVGAISGESMTYSTTMTERADLVDLSLRPYIEVIEQRLSMDDITPRGSFVRLDVDTFVYGSPQERATYVMTLVDGGLTSREAGARMLNLDPADVPAQPPATQAPATPAPEPPGASAP